jgi:hypothetical protein
VSESKLFEIIAQTKHAKRPRHSHHLPAFFVEADTWQASLVKVRAMFPADLRVYGTVFTPEGEEVDFDLKTKDPQG